MSPCIERYALENGKSSQVGKGNQILTQATLIFLIFWVDLTANGSSNLK
jgi:hypothetical protein